MLKVGFARVDVTPPLGAVMAGSYKKREADGVLDPLELVALAARVGDDTVLMLTADFAGIWGKWSLEIRTLISEETGVPLEHIAIQGLHQHTAVAIGYNPHLYDEREVWQEYEDTIYYQFLYRKFVDAAKMAIDDLCEATMSVEMQDTAEKVAYIRRFRMKDGSTVTNPKREQIPDVVGPIGEPENRIRLVKFVREEARDIALVNFCMHPDMISGTKFSADWPGFVRRMTEKDLDVHCMVVNGAQGDTNHINRFVPPTSLTKYEYCEHVGRVITDAVVSAWDHTQPREATKVSGELRIKYVPTNTSRIDEIEECQRLKAEHRAGAENLHGMAERADVYRAAILYSQSLFQKVTLSVLRIGDVALAGYGGEPFTEYMRVIQKAVPDLFVIHTCITNDYVGYFPTKEAFEEGGYEAKASNYTSVVADVIQETMIDMLQDK